MLITHPDTALITHPDTALITHPDTALITHTDTALITHTDTALIALRNTALIAGARCSASPVGGAGYSDRIGQVDVALVLSEAAGGG